MKKYICVKPLQLECYDDDGFIVENKHFEVEKGEVFQKSEEKFRCVGSKDSIRLENGQQWLEISAETFAEHFAEYTSSITEKGGAE